MVFLANAENSPKREKKRGEIVIAGVGKEEQEPIPSDSNSSWSRSCFVVLKLRLMLKMMVKMVVKIMLWSHNRECYALFTSLK